jgi:hypothetical protein
VISTLLYPKADKQRVRSAQALRIDKGLKVVAHGEEYAIFIQLTPADNQTEIAFFAGGH